MPDEKTVSIKDLLNQIKDNNLNSRIGSDRLLYLLSYITGLPVPQLSLYKERQLTGSQLDFWNRAVCRLAAGEPVQYITGSAAFYGLELEVSQTVLIPRPETEGLVEWITASEQGKLQVLDIGTGSGAIALALKKQKPEFKLWATDISPWAIKQAEANADRLALKVIFIQADLFPSHPQRFDLIVSNPPYISAAEYNKLAEEVRCHEPGLALLAENRGLEYYERIIRLGRKHLFPKGKIYLEIGETQAQAVSGLARREGYSLIELKQDLTGRDRYLRISC